MSMRLLVKAYYKRVFFLIFYFRYSTIISPSYSVADTLKNKTFKNIALQFSRLPQQTALTKVYPLVNTNVRDKIKAFDSNLKLHTQNLQSIISNNFNAAVAHLTSAVSNKVNTGVASLKHNVASDLTNHKFSKQTEKKYQQNIIFAATRFPFYGKVMKNHKLKQSQHNIRSKIPNNYETLMTDLGISGYSHFENAVLRDLEKREEQKVEATIHTLFDNATKKNFVSKTTRTDNNSDESRLVITNKDPAKKYIYLNHVLVSEHTKKEQNKTITAKKSQDKVIQSTLPANIQQNKPKELNPQESRHNLFALNSNKSDLYYSSSKQHIVLPMNATFETEKNPKTIGPMLSNLNKKIYFDNQNSLKLSADCHEGYAECHQFSYKYSDNLSTKRKRVSVNRKDNNESTTTLNPKLFLQTVEIHSTQRIGLSKKLNAGMDRSKVFNSSTKDKLKVHRGSIKFRDHLKNSI